MSYRYTDGWWFVSVFLFRHFISASTNVYVVAHRTKYKHVLVQSHSFLLEDDRKRLRDRGRITLSFGG